MYPGFTIGERDDRDHTKALINFRKALMNGRVGNEVARGVYDSVVSCQKFGPSAGDKLLKDLILKVKKVSKPPTI